MTVSASGSESTVARYHRLREELLSRCKSITELVRENNKEYVLLNDFLEILGDLERDSFKIGLFGVTAAGKSTLINALMRESLLREGLGETTRTLTVIQHPDDTHPHGMTEVTFKNMEQINTELQAHLLTMGFLDVEEGENDEFNFGDPDFRARLTDFTEKQHGGDNAEAISSHKFLRYLLDGWQGNESRLGDSLQMSLPESDTLVHDRESDACYISQRVIYHQCPITEERFTFIDAPGVGSALARHTDEALKVAQQVDAAILVSKVDYKFMPADRKFLRDAMDVQRMQERHNLLFVLNQIGRINPIQFGRPPGEFRECIKDEVLKLKERLAEEKISDAVVKPVDAACGRWTRRLMEDENDQDAYDQLGYYEFRVCRGDLACNLEMSGIEAFETYLRNHLTDIRYIGFLGSKKDRLTKLTTSYRNDMQSIVNEYGKKLEELNAELNKHEQNRDFTKEKLDEFFDLILPERLKNAYQEIEDDIREVIDKSSEIIASTYNKLHKKFYRSKKNFMSDVIKEANPKISPLIEEVRNKYERKYEEIKNKAMTQDIPHIISSYGKHLDFSINKKSIGVELTETLKGLEGIKLGWWQKFKGKIAKCFKKDITKDMVHKNYKDKFQDGFERDINHWVIRDLEHFIKQNQEAFEKLMIQIEDRKKRQIKLAERTESERIDYKQQLIGFIERSDEELNLLSELESEIQRVRG